MSLKPRIRLYVVVLFLLGMLFGQVIGVGVGQDKYNPISDNCDLTNSIDDDLFHSEDINSDYPLSSSVEGIMNPIEIVQSGYIETENISARTDIGSNLKENLTIDTENGWVGSETELEIWDLQRLYTLNGSFDEGVVGTNTDPDGSVTNHPIGWDAFKNDTDPEEIQYAYYRDNDEGKTVEVRNRGVLTGGGRYLHTKGTRVVWVQTVSNTPYLENFTLNFDYYYDRGPVGNGNHSISIFVDDERVHMLNLSSVPQRDVWFNTGDILLNLTGAGATFDFMIGLELYDNTNVSNRYLAALVDNVFLVGRDAPSFSDVDIEFSINSESVTVTEETGTANIKNSSYWRTEFVTVKLESSFGLSFKYKARINSYRYFNSTWTQDPSKEGVLYESFPNESPSLSLNTYVGTSGQYNELMVSMTHPEDWQNATVLNPYLSDVTSQCNITDNIIEIPTSLLSTLGWWKINLESPNYAEEIETQCYNTISESWDSQTRFRPSNKSRVSVTLGTQDDRPQINSRVNVSWIAPNDTIWFDESLINGPENIVNSSEIIFGSTNTSAGEWSVEVLWANGTEIAHGSITFDVYHTAKITPVNSLIETDVGLVITNFVYYIDEDTNEKIMDGSTTIQAAWVGGTVDFAPNLVHNWWSGDFNTALVGGGDFQVSVNVTRPFYDDVSCQFKLRINYTTNLDLENADTSVHSTYLEPYQVDFRYELSNDTGISNAIVDVSYSGPENGLSISSISESSPGDYSFDIVGLGIGTYYVSVSCSKDFHHEVSKSFTLVVNEIDMEFESLNGTSDFTTYGTSYRLVVQYTNTLDYGMNDATVQVEDVSPSTGLTIGDVILGDDGHYSFVFTPVYTTSFTIVIKANLTNHETQYTTFTLTVSEIPTLLGLNASSATIAIDHYTAVKLYFADDSSNGIEEATISVLNMPEEMEISSVYELGLGYYEISMNSSAIGSFAFAFRASSPNYQNSTTEFTLTVTEIKTIIETLEDIKSKTVLFGESYILPIYYLRPDLNMSITCADVEIICSPNDSILTNSTACDQFYSIRITTEEVGTWTLTIIVSKSNHETATFLFTFHVIKIDTSLNSFSISEPLIFSRIYTYDFNYTMYNQTGIVGAQVVASGDRPGWVTIAWIHAGVYQVILNPLADGVYTISLRFEKEGFGSHSTELVFEVEPAVPELIIPDSSLSGTEGDLLYIEIQLLNPHTNETISGAEVRYWIFSSVREYQTNTMHERDNGTYDFTFLLPVLQEGESLKLKLQIERDNYNLPQDFEIVVSSQPNIPQRLAEVTYTNFLTFGIPIILLGAVVAGRRSYKHRLLRLNKEALGIKRRFDDLRGLIGVVVLHKRSGLLVYSKILKGGFNESMVAAFITAITQFKSEFEPEEKQDEFIVVPISDIIRAVSTMNLICSFITVTNPTPQMEENMLEFAKQISFFFDEEFENTPTQTLHQEQIDTIDSIFDGTMDGYLLRKYKLASIGKFPKGYRCIQWRAPYVEHDGEFVLEELAESMAACGIEEGQVYKKIFDAIETNLVENSERSEGEGESIDILDVDT